jgi:hypothetical protein
VFSKGQGESLSGVATRSWMNSYVKKLGGQLESSMVNLYYFIISTFTLITLINTLIKSFEVIDTSTGQNNTSPENQYITLTLAIAIRPDIYLVGTLDILQGTRPVYKWVVQDCRMAIRHKPITMVRVLRRDKYNTNNTERQVVLSRHTRIGLMTYEFHPIGV